MMRNMARNVIQLFLEFHHSIAWLLDTNFLSKFQNISRVILHNSFKHSQSIEKSVKSRLHSALSGRWTALLQIRQTLNDIEVKMQPMNSISKRARKQNKKMKDTILLKN